MSSLVFIPFFDQTSLSENQNDFSTKLGGSYIERVVKTIGQRCEKGTTSFGEKLFSFGVDSNFVSGKLFIKNDSKC